MPLVLQLHLIMMSKFSKFGVDSFNTFWVMGYIKVLHDNYFDFWQRWRQQQRSSDHNNLTFSLVLIAQMILTEELLCIDY